MEQEYKEINLSKSTIKAIVSEEDFNELIKYTWYLNPKGYAVAVIKGKNILMHRLILKAGENMFVDHINNIRHDNRRVNLRIVTPSQNNQNKKVSDGASSKYRGVYYVKARNKYEARIIINGERYNIGKYDTEMEAAEMIDKFILYKKCEFINLNFPDRKDKYLNDPYIPKNKYENKTSKYFGVGKERKKFQAFVVHKTKTINIGYYHTEIEAAEAFDEYVVKNKIYGKKLNFPNKYPEYFTETNKEIKTLYEENDGKTIKILMCNNKKAIIDKDDYDKIKYYSCCPYKETGYVLISVNRKSIFLHRYIMGITDRKIFVDHIDGNTSNNSKSNLRLSNSKLNAQNRVKTNKETSSRFIGVCYCKKEDNWSYFLTKDGKSILTGSDKSEEKAARKRDIFILLYLKDDHYKLNFQWTEAEINKWKKYFDENKWKSGSEFYGITYNKQTKSWTYNIIKNGKNILNGRDKNEIHAAKRRDLFILKHLKNDNYKLNFEWTEKEISEWENFFNNQQPKGTSMFNGICFNKKNNTWMFYVNKNGKRIFYGEDKSETISARKRDLFILLHLKDSNYKLNFNWNPKEIDIWKRYFIATGWNRLQTYKPK